MNKRSLCNCINIIIPFFSENSEFKRFLQFLIFLNCNYCKQFWFGMEKRIQHWRYISKRIQYPRVPPHKLIRLCWLLFICPARSILHPVSWKASLRWWHHLAPWPLASIHTWPLPGSEKWAELEWADSVPVEQQVLAVLTSQLQFLRVRRPFCSSPHSLLHNIHTPASPVPWGPGTLMASDWVSTEPPQPTQNLHTLGWFL